MDHRARRDAAEHAFALEQEAEARDGLGVRHEELPVELGDVEDRRHVPVLERAEAHDLVAGERLGGGDDDVGKGLAEPLAGAHQRPARPEPGHEDVDTIEGGRDLGARAVVVRSRVRRVRVLERHEVRRVGLRELECEPHGAVRALLPGRLDDRGAVEPKQTTALGRHVRRDDAGERMAAQPCGERERDAGVPARRLEQVPSGLELARSLGGVEHRLRDPILDRPARILSLELCEETDGRLRREAGQLDDRGRSDEVEERRRDALREAGVRPHPRPPSPGGG